MFRQSKELEIQDIIFDRNPVDSNYDSEIWFPGEQINVRKRPEGFKPYWSGLPAFLDAILKEENIQEIYVMAGVSVLPVQQVFWDRHLKKWSADLAAVQEQMRMMINAQHETDRKTKSVRRG